MFTTQALQTIELIEDETLTARRLPVRNPLATKNLDGSYTYMHQRYYSRSTILKRGWTQHDIETRLGDCDVTTINPYNERSHMDLFIARDVEDIEASLKRKVLTTSEALAVGDNEYGIKLEINTMNFAGVYYSDGSGSWYPSKRNQRQIKLTTGLIEFWFTNGYPVRYVA